MDESRIKLHIKPLIVKRIVRKVTIADVEQMQKDVLSGKTAKAAEAGGRDGTGAASRCLGTLQAILGQAKLKGLIDAHPKLGAKKLAGKKTDTLPQRP